MTTREQAVEAIRAFRRDDLPVFHDCEGAPVAATFLDWLETETPEFASFSDVSRAAGHEVSDHVALWTFTILAKSVLTGEILFVDDDGAELFMPAGVDFALFSDDPVHHPVTGEELPDRSRFLVRFRLHGRACEPFVERRR